MHTKKCSTTETIMEKQIKTVKDENIKVSKI
jgi:hypothetical protein